MKKYFTKYLPVEGEIKEPCFVQDDNIFSDNKIVELVKVDTSIKDHHFALDIRNGTYSHEGMKKLKKVKLFLCSRDIQVGDEYYKYGKDKTLFGVYSEPTPDCFKVIGEISPDALIYVKEGDIFIENYIELVGLTYYSSNSSGLNTREIQKIAERKGKQVLKVEYIDAGRDEHSSTVDTIIYWTQPDYVKIKGPCGHFH
jgi:hypothetical protein